MKQVAIYAYKNVVTTGREVPTQIEECTRYAERMGFEIVKVYADTGTRQQREKLLKDSRKEKFSRGLCTTSDRIGRQDHIRILQKLYKSGIVLYYTLHYKKNEPNLKSIQLILFWLISLDVKCMNPIQILFHLA